MGDIRFYLGDVDDFDGSTREEVVSQTYEYESEAEDAYRDMLNDVHEPFRVGGLEYDFAETWQSVDPTAFRQDFLDCVAEVDLADFSDEDEDDLLVLAGEDDGSQDDVELRWFEYRQNNSGGFFDGPAAAVWVQAKDAESANEIVQRHGVYFDSSIDCDCCGARWSQAWVSESGEKDPWFDIKTSFRYLPDDVLFVHADGMTEYMTAGEVKAALEA